MFVRWRQLSPDSVKLGKPHSELPQASHLHLTVRPAWNTLLNPVLPDVCPRARAKARLPFPTLLARGLGFHWNTDFMQQTGTVWTWYHLKL